MRLESVHNAQEQAKTAATTILGRLEPYAQIPWFWSDQYDLKLQIVGFSSRSEQAVIRGDPESRSFALFFLDEGRLTSVYAVNSPREFMLSKKLIAMNARPDPALLRRHQRALQGHRRGAGALARRDGRRVRLDGNGPVGPCADWPGRDTAPPGSRR